MNRKQHPLRNRTFTVQQPLELLPWLVRCSRTPHGKALQLLNSGSVKVNGVVIHDKTHRLKPRDTVIILAEGTGGAPLARTVPFPVLFEDEHLVIIDKPSGLLSVGTEAERERTAHRMLGGSGQIHVVHRLDRETSGVLVFAKSLAAKETLQSSWDKVEKEYFAVVDAEPAKPEGTLIDWLREDEAGLAVHVTKSETHGKRCVTHYRVLASHKGRALLGVRIETGRKHQIRVQLAHAGFPVAGDERYGTGKPAPRLALHAARIRFPHPETGEMMTVESPLPGVLARLVR